MGIRSVGLRVGAWCNGACPRPTLYVWLGIGNTGPCAGVLLLEIGTHRIDVVVRQMAPLGRGHGLQLMQASNTTIISPVSRAADLNPASIPHDVANGI